jgi:superfamily II DNA or RNA helicase
MIAEAWLSPFIAYVPEHQIDRSKLKVAQGEFTEGSAADAMSVATIVGDAVKEWQEKWGQGKTFMFCVNRNHAKVQMDAFNEAGVACGYIDAYTELDERRRIFKKLADGELKVIASVGCLVRGIDEDVRCVLDLAPTKSIIRHVQKIGRGLRPAEGKERLVIIDCAGNSVALGLVTEIFHDHLDMRKPAERGEAYKDDPKPAKPRKCPKCRMLIPPGLRACPSCQEKLPVHSNVTVMDGRLVEITAGSRKAAKERQDFYSGLLYYARKGNLKDGWAAYRYKERFGDWPKGLRVRGKQPSDEVKAFVTAQRREYLAAKKGAVSA